MNIGTLTMDGHTGRRYWNMIHAYTGAKQGKPTFVPLQHLTKVHVHFHLRTGADVALT